MPRTEVLPVEADLRPETPPREPAPAGAFDAPNPLDLVGQAVQRSRVITVLAPKGGLGKTTLAANLAVGLARLEPDSVVLVDADLQFGDVANVLGLAPVHTLPEMVSGVAAADDIVLKALLTPHAGRFFTVCGAEAPEEAEDVTAEQLAGLVRRLSMMFRYVILDTTPGLGEHTLAVLDETTDIVAVSGLAVPNLRALRNELRVLRTIGLASEAMRVVVNQAVDPGGLVVKDAAAILERDVDLLVPHSKAVPLSTNRGVPVLLDAPRDPAARAVENLVAALTGTDLRPMRGAKRKERS
ncbi:MAG: AAA family ATPase [Amnibacterium sp.]